MDFCSQVLHVHMVFTSLVKTCLNCYKNFHVAFKNAIGILTAVCGSAPLTNYRFARLQSCRRFISVGDCSPTEIVTHFYTNA